MVGGISNIEKQELLATVRDPRREASKKNKSQVFDELIAVIGGHRKHGARLLTQLGEGCELI